MTSLIQVLQQKANDPIVSVQEVVRLALLVAQKLNLTDFRKQMESELNGYNEGVVIPSYRLVSTNLKGWNHIRREWQPVHFDDLERYASLMTFSLNQPVGDLENLFPNASKGLLKIPLSKEQERQIIQGLQFPPMLPSEVTRFLDPSYVCNILGKVRNLIFTWSLGLEDLGVVGTGTIFSDQEKHSANTFNMTCNAENLTIVSSMNESQIQQANRGSSPSFSYTPKDIDPIIKIITDIKKVVDELDLATEKKVEIEADLQTLHAQIKSSNPKPTIIETALNSLITIFKAVPGDIASALVIQLLGIYSNA